VATFVFVGDPDEFQVDRFLMRALSREQAIQWPVGPCRDQIRLGDLAYLLRTEGGEHEDAVGGIVGVARVVRVPEAELVQQPELWRVPPRAPAWFALVEVNELRLSPEAGMLTREMLRKVPSLSPTGMARSGKSRDLRLTPEQTEALRVLWRRAGVQVAY
jgi:hypothetical protein